MQKNLSVWDADRDVNSFFFFCFLIFCIRVVKMGGENVKLEAHKENVV